MSLDTVELICKVEECFGISFTDEDAAQTRTVEDVTKLVWKTFDKVNKKELHHTPVITALTEHISSISRVRPTPSENIYNFLLSLQGQQSIASFCRERDWLYPEITTSAIWKPNVFRQTPHPNRKLITLKDLSDWIVSLNYKHFIDPKTPRNLYEIERVMIQITAYSVGIPIAQIELKHSFTEDLGID